MIHLFSKKHPIFPIRWANSIANWCLGVCSPKGTISIKNTATPKDGGRSLELDVNIEKVFNLLSKSIDGKNLSEVQKKGVAKIIEGSVNQKIITYKDGILDIDTERLKQYLEENDDESEEVNTPFELSVEINSGGTAVTEVDIFLPSLKFTYGGVEYDVETGTGTGYVAQVETGSKWYCIRGVGAGDLWLVDDSTSSANRMKFTQTAPSAGTVCIYIGKVSIIEVEGKKVGDGGQFYSPKRGKVDFGGGGGGGASPLKPLTLKAIVNSGKTAVSELRVYLPSLTLWFGRQSFELQTGSTAGYVTAVANESGWYKINGITTGTVYLIDCSTTSSGVRTNKVKFSTSAHTDGRELTHEVGTVSYTSGGTEATITQFDTTAVGKIECLLGVEHDSRAANDNFDNFRGAGSSTPPAGIPLDTMEWKRDVTHKQKNTGTSASPVWTDETPVRMCGIRFMAVTRIARVSAMDYFYWRWVEFDENGMLRSVSAEQGCFREVNYDYYNP